MPFSLKAKLIAPTLASVATIAAAVGAIGFGASTLAAKLDQSELAAVAMRNHTNADLIHDELRADVLEALRLAQTQGAIEGRARFVSDVGEHARDLRSQVGASTRLGLPPEIAAPLGTLAKSMEAYATASEQLVATSLEDRWAAEELLHGFNQQFEGIEPAISAVGEAIALFAHAQQAAAKAVLLEINLIGGIGLLLGLLIAGFAVWIGKFQVLSPLEEVARGLKRLAKGDYGVALPTDRHDEIGEISRALSAFAHDSAERIRLSRETRVLSELNEWLQSAKSEAELYGMIGEFLTRFLPDCRGSIYVYANSRDILECTRAWNGSKAAATMHPDDCWGLRRGRTYVHGNHEIEFHCSHVSPDISDHYCCIPILAHGETVGLLHLEYAGAADAPAEEQRENFAEHCRLGLAAREHVSLAIANVKLRDQLRDQSIRDVLTGLYNRRYLMETGRREFQRAVRGGRPVAVLSLDIDHFKTFNDNHGHDAGDAVLRQVGEVLATTFRGDDVACRYGGEEFTALLPGASPAAAAARAEQVRTRIESLIVRYADGNLPRITVSIGVASFPQSGSTLTEVMKVADEALYRAKELGRNRVEMALGLKGWVAEAGEVDEIIDWLEAVSGPDATGDRPERRSDGKSAA